MKFFWLLTISLGIHVLIWKGLSWPLLQPTPASRQPIVVDYLQSPQAQRAQKSFVTDTSDKRLKKAIDQLKKKAHFISKNRQRVQEEQVAEKSGLTRNRSGQSSLSNSNQSGQGRKRPKEKPTIRQRAYGDLATAKKRSPLGDNIVIGGASSISEHIPSVKTGGFTALNTDQFIYYTFYSRINERIRHRWVNHVRSFIDETPLDQLSKGSHRPQETRVEVLLTKEGEYVKTIIHKGSDFKGLDLAAVNAFLKSAPLPNPPEDLVAEDGHIHLYYSLYVILDPSYIARARR